MYGSNECGAAVRETEISAALGRLAQAADALIEERELLTSRIARVVAPATPQPVESTKEQQFSCDLAQQLAGLARSIESSTEILRSTRSRVEL